MSAWTTSPLVVGHRGGRGAGWPAENTIQAFERARLQGARAIELDVRTCSDGHAVVLHDPTLPLPAVSAPVAARPVFASTLREIQSIDLGGGATVPSLAQALDWAFGHGLAVNVELKYDVPSRLDLAKAAARAVQAHPADVLISSFDPALLAMAAALMPAAPRALLTDGGQGPIMALVREAARPPLVSSIHLQHAQVSPGLVARCFRRGLRIGAWTVNDGVQARAFIDAGISTIITDCPAEILAALGETRA